MKKKKIYGGFPLIEETRTDGWCYGTMMELGDPAGCAEGDGFVEAPDGTRAGLDWVVRKQVRIRRVFPPDRREWGIYEASFPEPVRTVEDLARNFRMILPRLKTIYAKARRNPHVLQRAQPPCPGLKRVLFVCGRNRLRSPTAEQVFASHPGIECASAGTNHDSDSPLTPELIEWAELIFVMEKAYRSRLMSRFSRHLSDKRVICLDIPDEYGYMDPALVRLLKTKVSPFLPPLLQRPAIR